MDEDDEDPPVIVKVAEHNKKTGEAVAKQEFIEIAVGLDKM